MFFIYMKTNKKLEKKENNMLVYRHLLTLYSSLPFRLPSPRKILLHTRLSKVQCPEIFDPCSDKNIFNTTCTLVHCTVYRHGRTKSVQSENLFYIKTTTTNTIQRGSVSGK